MVVLASWWELCFDFRDANLFVALLFFAARKIAVATVGEHATVR